MDERLKFVGEYVKQERSMSAICRAFGISRKTGYKLVSRYLDEGYVGLYDRSRAPYRQPHAVTEDIESAILSLRELHGRWGPRKLKAWLSTHRPRTEWPSVSTMGRVLARHGAIVPRIRKRRCPPYLEPFSACTKPNSLWCADFKGWFRTGDGQRCEPLTISDGFSRYLLSCRVLPATTHRLVRPAFEMVFRQYGLPWALRTDNGTPFASTALGGLSRLAVWWIKLGILPERIEPGCPEQNGRHERMHRTLKEEAISPPRSSAVDQQVAFDRFRREYNQQRPHEGIDNRTPASIYTDSPRPYPSHLPEMAYPDHMVMRKVRPSGLLWWHGQEYYMSETLVGEWVGLEPLNDRQMQINFGPIKLAVLDVARKKLIRPPIKRWKRV